MRTTDGVALTGKHGAGALTAEICREDSPSSKPCSPVARSPAISGEQATFSDPLPLALGTGTLRPLYYRVRILNGRGKGESYSSATTLAGNAPPQVTHLQVQAIPTGAELTWRPDAAADDVRTLIRVERGVPQRGKSQILAVETMGHDRGGAVDGGATPGMAQRYTVTREKSVTVAGQQLTISSASGTVTLPADSKLASPAPPAGLDAVAATLNIPEVDLVWQASSDAAAYKVYRAEGGNAPVTLTATPQSTLTYTDTAIRPGVQYRYSVAAVNAQGTEGNRCPDVVVAIPLP